MGQQNHSTSYYQIENPVKYFLSSFLKEQFMVYLVNNM